jgi:hypothetical protein
VEHENDYWKQRADEAKKAVDAAFEVVDARYHLDADRMLGEAMRQCKGKNHPTLVHAQVLVKVEEKIVELKRLIEQQLSYVINGPLGLHIGSRQDIDMLERTLVTRVYEHSLRQIDYNVLVRTVNEVIKACLAANNIPDYRDRAALRLC